MLLLYSAGGAQDFDLLQSASDEYTDQLLYNASQVIAARGETEASALLATLNFSLSAGANDFGDEFEVLHAQAPFSQYEYLREAVTGEARKEYKHNFSEIASVVTELGHFIRFVVCDLDQSQPPENWRNDLNNAIAALSSNQALFTFKDSRKLVHEGLNFRSKTEIKIYDELVSRGVLVFPLPLAVLGQPRKYKEPDFVVCFQGKIGILEIHGDKWHPPETAAQEHERRRLFTKLGVATYEIFDAERCWNDPKGVVSEFLRAFKTG